MAIVAVGGGRGSAVSSKLLRSMGVDVEIRQLRYVVRLAETLHFGRAARLEHIAQSAFSVQLSRLERELGIILFDRSAHRVALTPAGAAFVERAGSILAQLTDAAEEARTQASAGQQVLRVGSFAEAAGELTPSIFSAYRELRPGVQLEFTELTMADQLERLLSGDVDVAIVRGPFEDDRIDLTPIFAEPRVAALPRLHPMAEADGISVDDLLDEPFAVADTGTLAGWGEYWACDDRRGEPGRVATRVRSVGESLMAISCMGAVDTFPQTAARLFRHPGVVYVPLTDAVQSTIYLASLRKDSRPHVQAFDLAVEIAVAEHLGLVPDAVPITDY